MSTQRVKVTYDVNVKTRTVVKVTAAVCFTVVGCRVVDRLLAPHIRKMTRTLENFLDQEPVASK